MRSRVKWFDESKYFGFIADPRGGAKDIFVHGSAVTNPESLPLQEGDEVLFDIGTNRKGECARNVRVLLDV